MKLEGLADLEATLLTLGTKAANTAVRKSLIAGGRVFQRAIQELAPVRPDLPSGTKLAPGALKSDIELAVGTDDKGLPLVQVSPGKRTAYVAEWVEYGHRLVRGGYSRKTEKGLRGPGSQVGNVPAHPFIRPGFEASVTEALEAEQKTFAVEIEKSVQAAKK